MAEQLIGKGFVAGVVGGLVGTAVLDGLQEASVEGTRRAEESAGGLGRWTKPYTKQQERQIKVYEHAHSETADWVVGKVGVKGLSTRQRKAAAPIVHYLFGALCGGVYGALAELAPVATAGFGTVFGLTLFAGASEGVLPAIGLIPGPTETPVPVQVGGAVTHVVYGATTEGVRRLVRSLL